MMSATASQEIDNATHNDNVTEVNCMKCSIWSRPVMPSSDFSTVQLSTPGSFIGEKKKSIVGT